MFAIVTKRISADDALSEIASTLRSTVDPDPELIEHSGSGPLESLFHGGHEEELWPRIEQLAREDERFRRALSAVWAYDSPMFDQREALLEELGEFWQVRVSFVVYPKDFSVPPLLAHRAVAVDGEVPGGQLPNMLRRIADLYEREEPAGRPELWWDRSISDVLRPWMEARWALERALHEVDISSDPSARPRLFTEVEQRRQVEAETWARLRDAVVPTNDGDE
jgi:hypothetical protein